MACAKKCDRCGKYYDDYAFAVGEYNYVVKGRRRFLKDEGDAQGAIRDLCPECMQEFCDFLNRFAGEEHND